MAPSPDSKEIELPSADALKYREILKKNGVTELISEVIVKQPESGDGYASQSLFITVKFENQDIPQLSLFAKTYTTNPIHVEMISELKAFEKEGKFFMEYVPAARELCEEKGLLELMDIYPKCYYGDDKLILQEDLVEKGYEMIRKEEMFGLEEAKAALLTLAKHQAISYALMREEGGRESFVKKFEDFDFDAYKTPHLKKMMEPMMVNGVKNCMKILEKFPVKGGEEALARLKVQYNMENVMETLLKLLDWTPEDEPLLNLNHGDFWKNNIMFVKDNTGKVLHLKAVDLQLVRVNTPAIDLSYFLYTSVNPEVITVHLKPLLTLYFDEFKKVASSLGHPIEFSYERFFTDFRKKFKLGFWIGFYTAAGPGIAAFNDFDIREINDIKEFAEHFDKACDKWIEENPTKGEKAAHDVVSLMEHYYKLKLD